LGRRLFALGRIVVRKGSALRGMDGGDGSKVVILGRSFLGRIGFLINR
jgi:hypothetical protein